MASIEKHSVRDEFDKIKQNLHDLSKKGTFSNQRAERELRMAKVKQKVFGCRRADQTISKLSQTMANKGYTPLAAIEMAFSGEIYSLEV